MVDNNIGTSEPPEGIEVEIDTCHFNHLPFGEVEIKDGCLCISWEVEDGLQTKIFAPGEWKSVQRYKRLSTR